MLKKISPIIITLAFISLPVLTSADVISDLQAQVDALFAQLKALQSPTVTNPAASTAAAPSCIDLTKSLALDDTDAEKNGEVSKLQTFLAALGTNIYPEARITGYFGPATERAVQRWQAAHGVVSSGDPDTTGYGYVGIKTRAALSCNAVATSTTSTKSSAFAPATTQAASTGPAADLKINGSDGPLSLTEGQLVTVTWTSTGATDCTLSGFREIATSSTAQIVHAGTSGNRQLYANISTGNYSQSDLLACVTPVGAVTDQVVVKQRVYTQSEPAILSVTSEPSVIHSIHDSATISWKTQNLTSCALQYYIVNMLGVGYTGTKILASGPVNGSFVVTPESIVAGTDNPPYMAVGLVLVCKDANGVEQRGSVRFGPGLGYTDALSSPTVTPVATTSVNTLPTTIPVLPVTTVVATTTVSTAPTCSVSTDRSTVIRGDSYFVIWTSTGAGYMTGLQSSTRSSPNGHQAMTADIVGPYSRTLTFTGDGGLIACTYSITVVPQAASSIDGGSSIVTTTPTPTITGSAEGVTTINLGINYLGGGRFYTSPDVVVANNRWSFTFPNALPRGSYTLYLYSGTTQLATGSLVVDLNAHAKFTLTQTAFTTVHPSFSGTATNVSDLTFGTEQTGGLENVNMSTVHIPVVNGAWSFTVDNTLQNGQWYVMVVDPSTLIPLDSIGFTVTTPIQFGSYIGYRNGTQFIQTDNISQADALANCQLNARNNPISSYRCTWNGTEIYNVVGTGSLYSQAAYYSQGSYAPASTVTLTPNKSTYAPGETATITWNVATTSARIAQSYMTIVPVGLVLPSSSWPLGGLAPAHPYVYSDGNPTGSKSIVVPSTPGAYEFVYFSNTGYTEAGRGGAITVAAVQAKASSSTNFASALTALELALKAILAQLAN